MLAEAGVTVTEATGTFVTVMAAFAVFPWLVADTIADPAATAVTRPDAETVATAPLALVQLTVRPTRGLPAESCVLAVSCTVWPRNRLAAGGLRLTEATGTLETSIVVVPF